MLNKKEVYYKNAVIKSPRVVDVRRVRLVVDSRERNLILFSNPNKYEINLMDVIPNVSNIKLVSSTFPFSSYLINKNNNALYFDIGNTAYVCYVEIGDYVTGIDLALSMQNAMNAAVGAEDFRVEYVTRTDNFQFRCRYAFDLKFKGNAFTHPFNHNTDYAYLQSSIGAIIGFGIHDTSSEYAQNTSDEFVHTIKSEFRKNFNVDSCLIVHIGMLNLNVSTAMSVDESFAIISRSGSGIYEGQTQVYDSHQVKKNFTPPIKRIAKITVEVLDYHGNRYDFQNQDHRMEFVLESQIIQHP